MRENTQTIEMIKKIQRMALDGNSNDDAPKTIPHLEFLHTLIDPIIEQSYSDLIKRKNDFFVMTGPAGLAFHRLEKFSVVASTRRLPVELDAFEDADNWITQLVPMLRRIALAGMEHPKMFGIYVPFGIKWSAASGVDTFSVITRCAEFDTDRLNAYRT